MLGINQSGSFRRSRVRRDAAVVCGNHIFSRSSSPAKDLSKWTRALPLRVLVSVRKRCCGSSLSAMVTVRPDAAGVDPTELRDWSRRQLGSIKTPEVIVVADELPQTPTGKVLRRVVREQLEKEQ